MRRSTSLLAFVLIFGVASAGAAAVKLPLDAGFESSVAELRARGWRLPDTCSLSTEQPHAGKQCLAVRVPDGRNRYAELFIPVEPGKCYRARVWVRCQDVRRYPDAGSNRGAVIFCQWANQEKKWEPGGSFPQGLHGTHGWTLRHVPLVRPVPARVGYIQLLLGVEGAGTAWFDDLRVEEVTAWDGVIDLSPSDDEEVDVLLPLLRWRCEEKRANGALVELSQDSRFPDGAALQVEVDGFTCRAPGLRPGRWHWRVRARIGEGHMPPSKPTSFVVAEGAPMWPPTVTARPQWSASPTPTLEARLEPRTLLPRMSVTIEGRPAKVLSFEDGLLRFQPDQPLAPGLHPITIEASAHGRTEAVPTFFCNKQPASRVTIRDDNALLVDGEPFFPIGAYRDPSDSLDDFSGLLEAGFNLTHNYCFETPRPEHDAAAARRYLQTAHRHGIKVFMGLDRRKIATCDDGWCRRWVAELMDEPALLTWYLRDEPVASGLSPARMRQLHQTVKSIDPFHPTSTVFCVPTKFSAYGDTVDIFWSDPYPLLHRPLTMVRDWAERSREAAGSKRPVWIVLQGHDLTYWRDGKQKILELGEPTRPTYEETRCMAFIALASEANGLVWYWGPNSTYHIRRDAPAVWAGICRTVRELRDLTPFLVARPAAGDAIEVPVPLLAWSRQAGGDRLLALVNPGKVPVEGTVDLRSFGVRHVGARATGERVDLDEGKLSVSLASHEVRILQWRVGG